MTCDSGGGLLSPAGFGGGGGDATGLLSDSVSLELLCVGGVMVLASDQGLAGAWSEKSIRSSSGEAT